MSERRERRRETDAAGEERSEPAGPDGRGDDTATRRSEERAGDGGAGVDARLVLAYLAFVVVERLSPLWGRDDTLWAFGARSGDGFVDNAKYLYLHVAATHPEVRPVWLSKDRTVVRELQTAGYEAYHAHSLRGMALELRAGAVLVTHGPGDVNLACAGGAALVQLWHGVPLKTVGWDAERAARSRPARYAFARLAERVSLLALPSAAVAGPSASGLRIPSDRFAVTGYPRTDALVRAVPGATVGLDDVVATVEDLARDGRVLAYLPTFRANGADLADHLDLPALDVFLAERDAYLLVKTHPYERLDLGAEYDRIVPLPSDVDVYPLLPYADALLTDYSSVYVDYLLLDRPVVFYPFDYERYASERGFYFEYDAVTPGACARDVDQLLAALAAALEDDDGFARERRAVRKRFFDRPPGTHAERTYRAVRARL